MPMQLLARILAILLMLMTGGVFQTLAFASEGDEACAGEEDEPGEKCADCAFDCAMCLCCPLRAAAPDMPKVEVPVPAPLPEPAPPFTHALVSSGVSADIFQPPRA